MEIRLAGTGDTAGWLALVEQVRDSFPGLETKEALEEHRAVALDFISKESAICAKCQERIVGALLFSNSRGRAYRNFCMPSVAAEGSALMVAVNLTLFFSPKASNQFRNSSVAPSTSRPTVLHRLSINTWVIS